MKEPLLITMFGQVLITCAGKPISGFISKKALALYLYLALSRRPHSRNELATLLWSDVPDTEARASLRAALSNLRQILGVSLSIDRQHVAFNQEAPVWLDVAAFREGLQHKGRVGSEESIEALTAAVTLYRGELLEGFSVRGATVFEEWLTVEREQLRFQALQGFYMLAAHHTARGNHKAAISYVHRLLAMEPWHEEAHRQLMLLLALDGQRSAALMQYETCRNVLASELGIEPSEETVRLYQRIRSIDESTSQYLVEQPQIAAPGGQSTALATLPLVGRGMEYAWLIKQFDAARLRRGAFTLVRGEAGAGKTRIVTEVLRYVACSGAAVLTGQCYGFEQQVPYQPILGALRALFVSNPDMFHALPESSLAELSRLLPELALSPREAAQPALHEAAARQRLFEAVAAVILALAGNHPAVVLFLDDLHYGDAATIDLLRYLFVRLRGTTFWCVGAYRPEDLAMDHPLVRLHNDLDWAQQVALLELAPLGEPALAQLTQEHLGLEDCQAERLAGYLFELSDGNAGLAALLIQDLQQRRILFQERGIWHLEQRVLTSAHAAVPQSVRALIQSRLSRLPEHTRAVLSLAAVIGDGFNLQELTSLAVCEPECVSKSVELLLQHRLLCEIESPRVAPDRLAAQGGPRFQPGYEYATIEYRFTHSLFRQVIEENLSRSYRQRLALQVARLRACLLNGATALSGARTLSIPLQEKLEAISYGAG